MSYWDQYDFIDENPICTKRALSESNKEDNECKMRDLLNETWFRALSATVKSNYDSVHYLGPNRSENIVPRRSLIFRCLNIDKKSDQNTLHPRDWRVIIVGDCPSAKAGHSCSGIPFYDSVQIKKWQNGNASIKYFFFNLLQFFGYFDAHKQANYEQMSQILDEFDEKLLPNPQRWINWTMSEGVMWINQCLTIGGDKEKEQHQRFWKPILRSIIYTVLSAKRNLKAKHGKKGTLLVCFDKKTKNFLHSVHSQIPPHKKTKIRILRMEYDFSIHFEAHFDEIKFFQKINESLSKMGMDEIKWLDENALHDLKKRMKSENKSTVKGNENNNNRKNEDEEEQKYNDGDSDDFSC